jgi:hypothetical protein
MLSGLMMKIARPLGLGMLTKAMKEIAEGKLDGDGKPKYPPALTRFYWFMSGRKTWTGLVLKLVAAVAFVLGHFYVASAAFSVGLFLVTVGLADKAWNTALPPELTTWWLYKALSKWKGELTLLIAGAAYTFSPEGGCNIAGECMRLFQMWSALFVVAFELGLIDAAAKADGPAISWAQRQAAKAGVSPSERERIAIEEAKKRG